MEIEGYLTQGEDVEKTFNLKGRDIHATNKRLFVSKPNGREVQDYQYEHISSLKFSLKRYYWLIALGVGIIIVWSLLANNMRVADNSPMRWIGFAFGGLIAILGILWKKEGMMLYVIGCGNVLFEGKRNDLDDLFVIIRENKQVITSVTES